MAYTKTTSRYAFFTPNTANFSVPPPGDIAPIPDVKVGSAVKDWRKIVKAGDQAGSNYSRDSYVVIAKDPGFAVLHTTDFTYEGQTTGPNHAYERVSGYAAISGGRIAYSHGSYNASKVDGEALTRLYKKIRQESSHMNGLQFFGELREAIRMIKRPASALRDGLANYDRLLRKRKESVIKSRVPVAKKLNIWKDVIAGTWLESSFGWKPLIQDSKDIAETIGRIILPDENRTRVRSYQEEDFPSESVGFTNTYNNSTAIRIAGVKDTQTTYGVQYIVGLLMVPSGPTNSVDRMRRLSGLTLENFVPTLYELTPWSFLLDYFTNVGDIINSAFTNTANVKWQIRTTRIRTTCSVFFEPYILMTVFNPPFYNFIDADGKSCYTEVVKSTMAREVLSHLEIPHIEFSLPGSSFKWANIAALATSRYHLTFNRF